MGRRALNKNNIRRLTHTGGNRSISLTLPIEYVRQLGWREKQKVVVTKRGKRLLIEDWKK